MEATRMAQKLRHRRAQRNERPQGRPRSWTWIYAALIGPVGLIGLADGASAPPAATDTAFEADLAACSPSVLTDANPFGSVTWTIVGADEASRCQLRFVYDDVPNPAWVGKPLDFSLPPDRRSVEQARSALATCMEDPVAGLQRFACSGPLFAEIHGSLHMRGAQKTGSPTEAPERFADAGCGLPFEDPTPSRHRWKDHQTGLWGYLDDDNVWTISPRFLQAEPFSEGFAAVLEGEDWQLIDIEGNVLFDIAPKRFTAQAELLPGHVRYGAPIKPFLEGCAWIEGLNGEPPAILDSWGQRWLQLAPAALQQQIAETSATYRLEGGFSAGRARFSLEAFGQPTRYSYLGPDGEIAINGAFADAADFDPMLRRALVAPISEHRFARDHYWIDETGTALPRTDATASITRAEALGDDRYRVRIENPDASSTWVLWTSDGEASAIDTNQWPALNVGAFYEGRALARGSDRRLALIDPDGREIADLTKLALCSNDPSGRRFEQGRMLLMVARLSDGQCGPGGRIGSIELYENGRLVAIDRDGNLIDGLPQ